MNKKILIIDDEELLINSLVVFLEKHNFEVLIAKQGEDALVYVEEIDFNVIITDIRMPGWNGVKTMQKIAARLKGQKRNIPAIIFITGFVDKTIEQEAKKIDHIAYLHKPFHSEELLNAIRKGINS